MAAKTLQEIAFLISMPVDDLVKKFADAGVEVSADTVLTDKQKQLLMSLSKGSKSTKPTLIKKRASTESVDKGNAGFKLTIKKKASTKTDSVAKMSLGDVASKVRGVERKVAVPEPSVQQESAPVEVEPKEVVKQTDKKPNENAAPKTPKKEHKPVVKKEEQRDQWAESKHEYELNKKMHRSKSSRGHKANVVQSSTDSQSDFAQKIIKIPETIRVADLAQKMSIKSVTLMKTMMENGVIATVNQMLDQETAAIIVEMVGHKVELLHDDELERDLQEIVEHDAEPVTRAPVVTIMGHVDHGKTTLLDFIRKSRVTGKEASIYTAYWCLPCGNRNGPITFLDTPGHEAFTAMRARGTKVTDIVILVVAADDGVMPQTIEAIAHARAAGVPLVVAVNKMDKPTADPDRVMTELTKHEVIPESWGGDVLFKNISAKTGDGVNALLDDIALQAEMMELKAVDEGLAQGIIIESKLDKGRGPVVTVLVQAGSLKKGDILLVGHEFGRVRAMLNDLGQNIQTAGPATPVEVLGLSGLPRSGERAIVVPTRRKRVRLLYTVKANIVILNWQKISRLAWIPCSIMYSQMSKQY